MAERNDGSIAPRRSLSGPILPPPPPELAEEKRKAEEKREAEEKRKAAEKRKADEKAAAQRAEAEKRAASEAEAAQAQRTRELKTVRPSQKPPVLPSQSAKKSKSKSKREPRRTRRAQLRLVQVDAWSVMKTSFLLSIALGIVLVVAVAIIWGVLGAAGVWDSINSIVQQAVGGQGKPFDIEEYAGTSRVLGFTMIVAVIDVILITAIATLGAFLYNLSAALLGGIEVTLAEDSADVR
jgi:Transmembrane domain of unknown function (DUF3566)